jgi:hypothetical protein
VPELAPQLLQQNNGAIAHDVYLANGTLQPRYKFQNRTLSADVGRPVLSLLYLEKQDAAAPEYNFFRAVVMPRPMMQGIVGVIPADASGVTLLRKSDMLRIRSGGAGMQGPNGVPLCIPAPIVLSYVLAPGSAAAVTERPIAVNLSVVAVRADGARSVPTSIAVAGLDFTLFSDGIQSVLCTFPADYINTYAITTFEFYYSAYTFEPGNSPNSPDRADIQGFSAPAATTITANIAMTSTMTDYSLISERNFALPPDMEIVDVCATEEGHLIVAGNLPTGEGLVCVSERFIWNAFPISCTLLLPERVVTAVGNNGLGLIGTTNSLYQLNFEQGEEGPKAVANKVVRAPAVSYACMTDIGGAVVTPEGVYIVNDGAIDSTATLLNRGDAIYEDIPFTDVSYLAWRDGVLYAFGERIAFELSIKSKTFSERIFSDLTTLDGVPGILCLNTDHGGVNVGTHEGWKSLPFPDATRRPGKGIYRWKSKTFVFPQITTMAAFKAVGPCNGGLTVKVWCDQQLAAQFPCNTPDPCRIPSQFRGCEWAIELIGDRTIREVHLATSMAELSEAGT